MPKLFFYNYLPILACPHCQSDLTLSNGSLKCQDVGCARTYPIVDEVPILINEENSLFKIEQFVKRQDTTRHFSGSVVRQLAGWLPSLGRNQKVHKNIVSLVSLLRQMAAKPRVLIVGGGVVGYGMESLLSASDIDLVETDVSFGPRTQYICDGHDLPFHDEQFDGVVIQAVLEHVLNPYRVVEEIARVLRPGGLVYADTPFMQPGHMGAYDFTRFTHLGHRYCFRCFEEIDSGVSCGPGMALAKSYEAFLISFVHSKGAGKIMRALAHLTAFWLGYFDIFLINGPGAVDAAAACYFLGRKTNAPLSGYELQNWYRGLGA